MLSYSNGLHSCVLSKRKSKKSTENAFIANKEIDCGEMQEGIPKLHGLSQHFQLSHEAVLVCDLHTTPCKAGTRPSAA